MEGRAEAANSDGREGLRRDEAARAGIGRLRGARPAHRGAEPERGGEPPAASLRTWWPARLVEDLCPWAFKLPGFPVLVSEYYYS
jgi:hypothetical protein